MTVCYLCGYPIAPGDPKSDDHRVPRALLQGAAPKRRGFVFAGLAPTHPDCNHHFRGENFVGMAMRLLAIVKSGEALTVIAHPDDPNIEVLILDREKLAQYSDRDLAFFHLIDFAEPEPVLPTAAFFATRQKTNPERESLFVVLSVIAKSAAALLINKHLMPLPPRWRIETAAWFGKPFGLAADLLAQGDTYHEQIRVWSGVLDGQYYALYHAHGALVALQFGAAPANFLNDLENVLGPTDRLCFEGQRLLELIDHRWAYARPLRSAL